ncbi:MAG: hypothetical protein EHM60_06400 [Lysobacterales bacterium]|nr:MAG: hypothetical protein EHM60_06400 [Xanthomonadales bacterium]
MVRVMDSDFYYSTISSAVEQADDGTSAVPSVEWPDPSHDVDECFETISGLLFWRLRRIPKTNDAIRWRTGLLR